LINSIPQYYYKKFNPKFKENKKMSLRNFSIEDGVELQNTLEENPSNKLLEEDAFGDLDIKEERMSHED